MFLTEHGPSKSPYRVEVSGWDENHGLFVEKSELEWNEESGKQVALKHAVRDGAVISLRLAQPISTSRSQPVAYEAELIARTKEGQHQFRLHPACPRMEEREGSRN